MSTSDVALLHDNLEHLSPVWARYSDIVVEYGAGAYLHAADGRRYLDFTCGIGVTNTGHCHPRVVEAIREQAGKLLHGQVNIVYHKPLLELIGALREVVHPSLDSFFFSNSGAEAIEASVKLARQATGRSEIIAFHGGFHGRTAGAMALTSSKGKYRGGYQPLPAGVHITPYAYCYRCPVARATTDAAAISAAAPSAAQSAACCHDPLRALRTLLATQTIPQDVAAVLVEPVLGEGGYVVPPASFLQGLREICNEHGMLLIVDEVQTGFGRTGSFFAYEQMGIVPDILVMAKGLGSGLPISALAARSDLMARWPAGSHGGTYGGNALACAAASATIQVLRDERLPANAAQMGRVLMDGLRRLQANDARIGDVRGMGLMIGVEFVQADGSPDAATVKQLLAACRERGLLLLNCGIFDNVVRFIPPLIVDEAQIQAALALFADALGA
jgi:4-aminobutyrate aminotransferase